MLQLIVGLLFVWDVGKRVEADNLPVHGNIDKPVQSCKAVVDMSRPAIFGFQVEFIAPAEVFGNILKGDVPVSYTHLDVYKRQASN